MDDFDVLKSDFNIVNKSFVTLGKPFKFYRYNVYIRDPILLAPFGSGSLESLGRLYYFECAFSKRLVTSKDKEKMSNFMKKDQKVFEG